MTRTQALEGARRHGIDPDKLRSVSRSQHLMIMTMEKNLLFLMTHHKAEIPFKVNHTLRSVDSIRAEFHRERPNAPVIEGRRVILKPRPGHQLTADEERVLRHSGLTDATLDKVRAVLQKEQTLDEFLVRPDDVHGPVPMTADDPAGPIGAVGLVLPFNDASATLEFVAPVAIRRLFMALLAAHKTSTHASAPVMVIEWSHGPPPGSDPAEMGAVRYLYMRFLTPARARARRLQDPEDFTYMDFLSNEKEKDSGKQ